MSYIYDLTDTWNAAGTVFTSIKMNVTNSASANGSKLIDLQIGGVSLFNVDKNGGVGIGTTTPSTSLYVFGGGGGINSTFDSSTAADTRMEFRNNGTRAGYIYWDSSELRTFADTARSITLYAGSSERMRITSAGNVGIGNTNPRSVANYRTLSIGGLSNGGFIDFVNQFQTVLGSVVSEPTGSLSFDADGFNSIASSNINFRVDGSERMRITAAGDVGIGTTTPTAKLDVNGQLNVPDQLAYDFTTSVLPDIAPTLNLNFVGANAVDPRITFTRSTTATYYDADTTALAEQNLLLYSQEFDSAAWTKFRATIAANSTTAPDGTSTADKIVEDTTASNTHLVQTTSTTALATGQVYTYSFYAKQSGRNWVQSDIYIDRDYFCYFNLATGAVGSAGNCTGSIAAVGDGWFRCSITFTAIVGGSAGVYAFLATADNIRSYTGDGTSGAFVWGAQLEQRSVATAYTATTTTPITNYIPQLMTAAINQPRLDFDPVTRAPKGLLIEEARTNLVVRSEEFDTGWDKANVTITSNFIVSPDGTVDADLFTATATGISSYVRQIATVSASTAYTTSCFFKKGTAEFINMTVFDGTDGNRYWFNLTTGTVASTAVVNAGFTSVSASIQNCGNGWYRCTLSFTNKTVTSCSLFLAFTDADASLNVTNGKTGYLWGAQFEAGTFATSYIPTVATTVQRTADSALMTGTNFSSWYRADEGTIISQVYRGNASGTSRGAWSIRDSVGTTAMDYRIYAGQNLVQVAGATQADLYPGAGSANSIVKSAFAYKVNDFAAVTNGGTVQTDTSGSVPAVTQLVIGALSVVTGQVVCGHIQSIRYYPVRFANAIIQGGTA